MTNFRQTFSSIKEAYLGYRKYDPAIKNMIIKTGNRNLFPELKIPRTTINYWLKNSRPEKKVSKEKLIEQAISSYRKESKELRAINIILRKCTKEILKNSCFFDPKSKANRSYVVDLVEEFKNVLPIKRIISILGVSPTQYYRWRTEKIGCVYSEVKKCNISKSNQLTLEEQSTLIKFAKASHFKKFSTKSLMFYCKRKKILTCSLDSWYKYMKLYGVKRGLFKHKRKRYKTGIRAKNINEIWHIDITEVKTLEGQKLYLQLVIDNYSRMIVGWKVSQDKSMELTYKTLIKSFNISPEFKGILLSDDGRENTGGKPRKLLLGKGIKQIIAKKEIRFSNSMVEAVFRIFKQKYLFKEPKDLSSFYRLVYKFVYQYNYIIPHSSLDGITPNESFNKSQCPDFLKNKFRAEMLDLRKKRREKNLKCMKCSEKYSRFLKREIHL